MNQVEEMERFTAMSLLISHDKYGLNANVLKTCCASIIKMNVEELQYIADMYISVHESGVPF